MNVQLLIINETTDDRKIIFSLQTSLKNLFNEYLYNVWRFAY